MPPISEQITFLYVSDLTRSAQFYEGVLGFRLWLDQTSCRIYEVTRGGLLGICQHRGPGPLPDSKVIFTLVTPEVDAWYEALKAKGVVFEKAPAENPQYKIYHCFLRDPDNYLIEIQRFWGES
jgi:catechol 2,3-dioxygenase-like lactoylglutathione lyase family enzyme